MLELALSFLVFGLLALVVAFINTFHFPRRPDPARERPFECGVDLNRCCFCGFCVEACPVDAIPMGTDEIRLAAESHEALVRPLEEP